MSDWKTLIPATIEKAKKLLGPREHFSGGPWGDIYITSEEVALAEALWACTQDGSFPPWPDSLIAFTTKMEALA